MVAGCTAERALRRRRVFVGFVVSKVATIVTVRIQRPNGSGPSKGICSQNESPDTEEIGVGIVLRSAAFPPNGTSWAGCWGQGDLPIASPGALISRFCQPLPT